jgi:hypothetical protein
MSEGESSLLRDYVLNINTEQPNKLKIVHINAQSLRDTAHQTEFIDTFSECGIDIIVVSETWFKNNEQIFLLPGYKVYNANRLDRQGGGVAVFVKTTYPVNVLSVSKGDYVKPDYILLDILIGTEKILLSAMYRKPKGGYVGDFVDDFYRFSPTYKYSFLCGDLNAGFGRGGDDAVVVPEMLSLCNLRCVPYEATYHTATCDSLLDVLCSNCPDRLLGSGQTPASGFSAHDLIFAIFDLATPCNVKQKVTFRNFMKINVENLLRDVDSAQWSLVYDERDIDCKVEIFNTILTEIMDNHAPLKTKTFKHSSAPWMNDCIREHLKIRNRLRKKYNRSKSTEDLNNFRQVRNKVKHMIRGAKIKYYYEKFNSELDSRVIWNTIRSLNIGKTTNNLTDPVVDVNTLNEHYASVSTVRNESLINDTISQYNNKLENEPKTVEPDKFYFKYVLPGDILKAANSIKSKATGVDNVPIMFLQLCLPGLLPVLDHIFNFSLQNGVFPSIWKHANIIPIPKVKNPNESKDYRPVSILCVLGKVLEKLVHSQESGFRISVSKWALC